MPSDTSQTTAAPKAPKIEAFTVEFGDNCCRNFTLNTFREGRIRGAWSVQRLHDRPEGGRDLGAAMSGMPAIPGIHLRVEPREMMAYLEDPLQDQPELLARINRVARRAPVLKPRSAEWKPVPTRKLPLNNDTLKTLLHELRRKQEAGQIRVVKGRMPATETIDKLPGREMFDPWNSARKPTYRDEVPAWRKQVEQDN